MLVHVAEQTAGYAEASQCSQRKAEGQSANLEARNSQAVPLGYNFLIACAILSTVVPLPNTARVSNSGGAFLRPQTATRMG